VCVCVWSVQVSNQYMMVNSLHTYSMAPYIHRHSVCFLLNKLYIWLVPVVELHVIGIYMCYPVSFTAFSLNNHLAGNSKAAAQLSITGYCKAVIIIVVHDHKHVSVAPIAFAPITNIFKLK